MESCLHLVLSGRIRIDRRINGAPRVTAEQRVSIAGTHGLGRLLLVLEKNIKDIFLFNYHISI